MTLPNLLPRSSSAPPPSTSPKKSRAAGDSSFYRLALMRGDKPDLDHVLELPSVTTVLNVLNKPALVRWSYKHTVAAVAELLDGGLSIRDAEHLDELLTAAQARPFDARDKAATRGSGVHDLFAELAETGMIAESSVQGRDGFVRGLLGWWQKTQPEVVTSEEFVCSLRHGFAGTLDLVWERPIPSETELPWPRERVLTDLKTRRRDQRLDPYSDTALQLAAYELAWCERHPDKPIDRRSVLIVSENGRWKETTVQADPDLFLVALKLWNEGFGR